MLPRRLAGNRHPHKVTSPVQPWARQPEGKACNQAPPHGKWGSAVACNRYGEYRARGNIRDVLRQLRAPARDKWNSMRPGKLEVVPDGQPGAQDLCGLSSAVEQVAYTHRVGSSTLSARTSLRSSVDRAAAFEAAGREFDSLRGRHHLLRVCVVTVYDAINGAQNSMRQPAAETDSRQSSG